MAGRRRVPEQVQEHITSEMIARKIDLVEGAKPLRNRALIALLYLSGARVSEIVKNKKKGYEGLRMSQLQVWDHEGHQMVKLVGVPCLKRRKSLRKRDIPINAQAEKELTKHLKAYLQVLSQRASLEDPDPILFPITRQRAWAIIKSNLDLWPHYFRHARNTVLVTEYGFGSHELKSYNGWTSTIPADSYVHLDVRHIANKLLAKNTTP